MIDHLCATAVCATAVPAVLNRISSAFTALTADDWIAAAVLALLMAATWVLCSVAGDLRHRRGDDQEIIR